LVKTSSLIISIKKVTIKEKHEKYN
jgi:hypothetical protein